MEFGSEGLGSVFKLEAVYSMQVDRTMDGAWKKGDKRLSAWPRRAAYTLSSTEQYISTQHSTLNNDNSCNKQCKPRQT